MAAPDVQNLPPYCPRDLEAQVMELRRHPKERWLPELVIASDDVFFVHQVLTLSPAIPRNRSPLARPERLALAPAVGL
jgi:hypothetical protein